MKYKDLSNEEDKRAYKYCICSSEEFIGMVNNFIENYDISTIDKIKLGNISNSVSISAWVRSLKDKISGYNNISGNKIFNILVKHKVMKIDDNKKVINKKYLDKGYFIEYNLVELRQGEKKLGDVIPRYKLTPLGKEWLFNCLLKFNYINKI